MTDERMCLLKLIEKDADADLAQDAGVRCRSTDGDRSRGGDGCAEGRPLDAAEGAEEQLPATGRRLRRREARAGGIDLAVAKLRKGTWFPSFLEPLRTTETALVNENTAFTIINAAPCSPEAASTALHEPGASAISTSDSAAAAKIAQATERGRSGL